MVSCFDVFSFAVSAQEKKAAESAREKVLEEAKDEKRRQMEANR